MNDFTASNGATVTIRDYQHFDAVSVSTSDNTHDLAGVHTQALREFFQAEADERLGRWRWPENPDLVVYPSSDNPRYVRVLHEPTGQMLTYERNEYPEHTTGFSGAGNAYFDAHPEPKPWHDAKPGEVWALTWDGVEGVFLHAGGIWYGQGDMRVALEHPLRDENVTAGRRIWPEVSS